jgi:hypothetical protein
MKFFCLVVLWQFQTHICYVTCTYFFDELKAIVITPNFSGFEPKVWIVGLTIAIVASIETLYVLKLLIEWMS